MWDDSSVKSSRSRNSIRDSSQVATPSASTVFTRGPMSSQISDHTVQLGLPSAQGYLLPSVSRR